MGGSHAKSLYEEIKELIDKGEAAVPNEKYRMMWLGRGMWQDFGFYQRFEEKYGAVFMWSHVPGDGCRRLYPPQ